MPMPMHMEMVTMDMLHPAYANMISAMPGPKVPEH
jgi:hypothetical protein